MQVGNYTGRSLYRWVTILDSHNTGGPPCRWVTIRVRQHTGEFQ